PGARSARLDCGAAKSAGRPAGAAAPEELPGAATIGAAAIAEGFGGRGGGAAGAGAPATAGARWAAGAGAPAFAAAAWAAEAFPAGATLAVSRPLSGTVRTRPT